jgi:DNA mismatch endonuclease (patch repair protein)
MPQRNASRSPRLVPESPPASSAAVRKVMQANQSGTKPEIAVGSALHRRGLRYRKHVKPEPSLRCVADFVFRKARVAVFVDGCFWHGCPEHGRIPKDPTGYWGVKLRRNSERDRRNDEELAKQGWTVLRFWEHEEPERVAAVVEARVRRSRR